MAEPINMPFYGLTRVRPRNHVLDGVEIPHGKGQFFGVSGPLKSIGSLSCGVYSIRNHSIIVNNVMQ